MPSGDPVDFWRALRAMCGPLSPRVRRFIKLGGYAHRFRTAASDSERDGLVDSVATHVARSNDCGVWPGRFHVTAPQCGSGGSDGRWQLLRELAEARMPAGSAPEAMCAPPLTVEAEVSGTRAMPSPPRIVVTFDARLSLEALVRELRGLWPDLLAAEWLQRARPLKPRALALVRSVCLEREPGASWREVCRRWNAAHPEWAYAGAWALKSDFHRAEASLTGRRYGLDWHYDPAAREVQEMSADELLGLVWASGLTPAQERAFHRYAEWMSSATGSPDRPSGSIEPR